MEEIEHLQSGEKSCLIGLSNIYSFFNYLIMIAGFTNGILTIVLYSLDADAEITLQSSFVILRIVAIIDQW